MKTENVLNLRNVPISIDNHLLGNTTNIRVVGPRPLESAVIQALRDHGFSLPKPREYDRDKNCQGLDASISKESILEGVERYMYKPLDEREIKNTDFQYWRFLETSMGRLELGICYNNPDFKEIENGLELSFSPQIESVSLNSYSGVNRIPYVPLLGFSYEATEKQKKGEYHVFPIFFQEGKTIWYYPDKIEIFDRDYDSKLSENWDLDKFAERSSLVTNSKHFQIKGKPLTEQVDKKIIIPSVDTEYIQNEARRIANLFTDSCGGKNVI